MSQPDWDRAPWNQEDDPEYKVTVKVTLSKQFTFDGKPEGNLEELILDSKYLPQEAYSILADFKQTNRISNLAIKMRDLENWEVNDFKCTLDE